MEADGGRWPGRVRPAAVELKPRVVHSRSRRLPSTLPVDAVQDATGTGSHRERRGRYPELALRLTNDPV